MPTIKEIADIIGVSYSTVSRALNNKSGVKPEKRDRICKIAKEMEYFPHSMAKALVQNRVGAVGVIIPRTSEFAFQNPFYSKTLLGLSRVAKKHDYHLVLSINDEKSYSSLFKRRMVDGVIVIGNRIDDDRILELVDTQIPTVIIPGLPEDSQLRIASVNSENIKSVYRAVEYLIGLGHSKIAFILGEMNSLYSIERLIGYKAALKDNNIPYNGEYIFESDFSEIGGYQSVDTLLSLPDPPSSLICIGDLVAIGALNKIDKRGIRIPEDISFIAIGCSDIYKLYNPSITTIQSPIVQVGETAAEILIKHIELGYGTKQRVIIPSEFIIRDSTSIWCEKTWKINQKPLLNKQEFF